MPTAALTARLRLRVSVVVPEVPVMVTVANPVVAEALALNTTVCLLPVPCTEAVTPLGRPDTVRVTAPLNPFTSVIVIAALAVEL